MMTRQEANFSLATTKNDLVQIFKSLDSIVEDATFSLNSQGLTCRTMDPSHVSMLDIAIENRDFIEYNITEKQDFSLNVREFLSVLKELDKNGVIEITIKKDDIKLSQNGFNFNIVKKEPGSNDCPLPKIQYDTEIQFNGISNADLLKTCKKINSMSDYITFESNDNNVLLSGSGDSGKTDISFDKSKILIQNKADSISTYSLEYIIPFLKSVTKDTKIKMEYATTKPLKISTSIGVQMYSRIHYYLAPRVEN